MPETLFFQYVSLLPRLVFRLLLLFENWKDAYHKSFNMKWDWNFFRFEAKILELERMRLNLDARVHEGWSQRPRSRPSRWPSSLSSSSFYAGVLTSSLTYFRCPRTSSKSNFYKSVYFQCVFFVCYLSVSKILNRNKLCLKMGRTCQYTMT